MLFSLESVAGSHISSHTKQDFSAGNFSVSNNVLLFFSTMARVSETQDSLIDIFYLLPLETHSVIKKIYKLHRNVTLYIANFLPY